MSRGCLSGNIDRVTADGLISGWCLDPERPDARVTLAVLAGGEVAALARADEWRLDLYAAGIGDGFHGFSVLLPPGRQPIELRELASGRALGEPFHLPAGSPAPWPRSMADDGRPVALFVDDRVPNPDRDAGSTIARAYIRVLQELGWRVVFVAGSDSDAAPDDLARAEFSLAWITRHANFSRFAPLLRQYAPDVPLLFAPADLHFVRQTREAALCGLDGGRAEASRAAELSCARAADATLLLSTAERDVLLQEGIDGARLHVLPWIADPAPPAPGFAGRDGALFVGGFAHRPNLDAVLWYAREIQPRLRALRPGIALHVVGTDPPPDVRAVAGPELVVHGWVPDLSRLIRSVRLTVAPLRYGAGFKGKVATSLAHGLPLVATSIATEGTELSEGDGLIEADTPEAFAAGIARLHDDAALWQHLAARGRAVAGTLWSRQRATEHLARVLAGLALTGTHPRTST